MSSDINTQNKWKKNRKSQRRNRRYKNNQMKNFRTKKYNENIRGSMNELENRIKRTEEIICE